MNTLAILLAPVLALVLAAPADAGCRARVKVSRLGCTTKVVVKGCCARCNVQVKAAPVAASCDCQAKK